MSNRKQRRAAASVARRRPSLPPPPTHQLKPPILVEYETAAQVQKLLTELHDACVESQAWCDSDDFAADREEFAADAAALKRMSVDARHRTIEAGMGVAQLLEQIRDRASRGELFPGGAPAPGHPPLPVSDEGVSDAGLTEA